MKKLGVDAKNHMRIEKTYIQTCYFLTSTAHTQLNNKK